jgi:UDP-N-acetylmuramoyl-tripeptide--D-alanyl-D-alanine ligase
MQNGCDVQFGRLIAEGLDRMEMTFYANGREYAMRLPLPGVHNVMNALSAVAAGVACGVKPVTMLPGLEKVTAMKMRMERVQLLNGVQVVNDSYNANPSSMLAALRTVGAAKKAGRFVAVLGDMLELGPAAKEKHLELGRNAASFGVTRLFAAGNMAGDVAEGAIKGGLAQNNITTAASADEIKKDVLKDVKTGDIVLVKGSRGMKMETVVEYLKNEIGV